MRRHAPRFPRTARGAALEALERAASRPGFLRDHLHAVFDEWNLPARDRALATQLASGAVRHRRTIGYLLGRLREGPRAGRRPVQPPLRRVLEVGAFQLLFLDRVPAYAAVGEAVEAALRLRGSGRRKAAGFVNALLRALAGRILGRDPEGRPGPDAVPHPEGGVVRLAEPMLPDPADGPAAFLGVAYSYPDWLVERWLAAYGPEQTEAICRWQNRRPRTFARVTGGEAGAAVLRQRLAAEGFEAPPGPRPGTLDLSALPAERLTALAEAGEVTVQDPSAMAPVEALDPQPGETVLDLCAAPGTKTTQMVEAMGGRGWVVACDVDEAKLEALRRLVAARRLEGVDVVHADQVEAHAPSGGFDAALVDVPCSNTGVLARRVEARWRVGPDGLEELADLQRRLLERAMGLVRPGGRVVYSTCSLLPEENDRLIRDALRGREGWRLAGRDLIFPGPDRDGAFWALVVRE